jgi:hypothetical protein
MILLSITGLFRTVLIVIGVIVILRAIGKLAQAKRNVDAQAMMKKQELEANRLREESKRDYGKTSISHKDPNASDNSEYVEFEEVDD